MGAAAACVVSLKFPDAVLIPAQYGDTPPDVSGQDVFIVDFSYKRPVLERMYKKAKSLVVYDHHKTAEKELEGLDYAVFDKELAGCSLTWRQLFPGSTLPRVLYHITKRDLWQHELYDDTDAICTALWHSEQDLIKAIKRVLAHYNLLSNLVFDGASDACG